MYLLNSSLLWIDVWYLDNWMKSDHLRAQNDSSVFALFSICFVQYLFNDAKIIFSKWSLLFFSMVLDYFSNLVSWVRNTQGNLNDSNIHTKCINVLNLYMLWIRYHGVIWMNIVLQVNAYSDFILELSPRPFRKSLIVHRGQLPCTWGLLTFAVEWGSLEVPTKDTNEVHQANADSDWLCMGRAQCKTMVVITPAFTGAITI